MAKMEVDIRDSEGAVVEQALESLVPDARLRTKPEVAPPQITDLEEVAAIRRAAAGMWKDRTDLPDVVAMRRESDDRLERLLGDV